jgi:Transposase DDE domain group 1
MSCCNPSIPQTPFRSDSSGCFKKRVYTMLARSSRSGNPTQLGWLLTIQRLQEQFVGQFIASFSVPPRRLTFDIDAVDDPAHGEQQLVLFHGYFDQYQYFPLFITCAENDQVVMLSLRHGSAHAALGADDDVEFLVTRLRQVWPDVQICIRGDAGCGMPWMYRVCERLNVDFLFGITSNSVLRDASEALLDEAVASFEQSNTPQRLFDAFWYKAGTWEHARWVIVKAEAHAQGTNRRFIVTNRPGALVLPAAAHDEYAERGESENRNKELKCDLQMDRTSDHRFCANYFRLYLHCAAFNLLVRFRHAMALPPLVEPATEVPTEALADDERLSLDGKRVSPPWTRRKQLCDNSIGEFPSYWSLGNAGVKDQCSDGRHAGSRRRLFRLVTTRVAPTS